MPDQPAPNCLVVCALSHACSSSDRPQISQESARQAVRKNTIKKRKIWKSKEV